MKKGKGFGCLERKNKGKQKELRGKKPEKRHTARGVKREFEKEKKNRMAAKSLEG